ncbi:DUF3857 domain-containing protein [Mucilaginibacter terrae]|uniref:Transglutaminase-like putative cysteine protease n=1 Tax=Mucilaginibacter terrae TaxID=1955052 RepID=A0ABU3GRH4_9SPHI|nr:DUF3857 domain-containing protein [Mucilaginibacter terrae]MDT3402388.1 transglutaminase-like putative cysteine protease [Mucilaginibacter terrae]
MKRIFTAITFLLSGLLSADAQNIYTAADIDKSLLPYASAVIRNQEITTEVKDLNNTIYRFKEVVTVLNKNGDDNVDYVVWYDKSNRIKNIKGTIYNEFGKQVSKFSEKNFKDYAAADGFSMFLDDRYKRFQPAVSDYPYTVEYEYEIASKQSLIFHDWRPNYEPGTSVEHSSYQFICKPDFNIRYKEFNTTQPVKTETNAAGLKTYTWEANKLKALRGEPYSPDAEHYKTIVKIAPEKFSYEGIDGSFTNWNDLGKWVYDKLLNGRTTLPPETVAYLHSLTDTIKEPKQKAKAVYEYMQQKSRYVSIQVGIGGYQPFTATDVDRTGYGDCKALVNYTQAMLKAVNIDSYYCVVTAGDYKKSFSPDFASMQQGNHIILCLPFKNDTTWLECTSKEMPFGFLGDFTDDRTVLACTAQGGKLLHTPKYTAEKSKQIRKGVLTLKNDGLLSGSMTTTFEGCQFDNRPITPGEISDEIKKAKENYSINNLDIESLEYKAVKNIEPVNNEKIKFTARDYASIVDGRYYFIANLANRHLSVPREVRNRNNDVYINRGYTDIDEITYEVPAGYKMDSNPLLVNINKPFGKFTATAFKTGDKVIYKRKMELFDGTYTKDQYAELIEFYQAIADADSYKVALVKAN